LPEDEAWPLLQDWNRRNEPPLDEDELRKILRNGKQYAKRTPGNKLAGGSPWGNCVSLEDGDLRLCFLPEGKPMRGTLRVQQHGQIFIDQVNLAAANRREAFAKAACERLPDVEFKVLDARLQELASRQFDTQSRASSRTTLGQGSLIRQADPEPWHEPVDGAVLLDELVRVIHRFVVMPEVKARVVALWIVFTYLLEVVDCAPILAITSPTKRCGKTRLLELLASLCFRPLAASNITPAALYRTIEACQPTLLIDEGDTFLARSEELRGILNAGHTRTTAYVIRTVGEQYEPRSFTTWGAKAIALIGHLADTLQDRSLEIRMQRKTAGERCERPTSASCEKLFAVLRRKCRRFSQDIAAMVKNASPQIPDGLDDRAADNWRPLLAIADAAGGRWPQLARNTALQLARANEPEESLGVRLLADMKKVFAGAEFLKTKFLIERLSQIEEAPWGSFCDGRPITPRKLANLLRPFGIKPTHQKAGNGYLRKDFQDAWKRYLPGETSQAAGAIGDRQPSPTAEKTKPTGGEALKDSEGAGSRNLHC